MKRRTFIKCTGTAGLITLITPLGIIQTFSENKFSDLENGFREPPASARPHTWWHWMNGHVTAEGITLDLEAMKNAGIGGFQNFSVGSGIPIGPVEYLSSQWLSLMKHAIKESGRLGLEFQMHNCPGWSSSGGPWVTPEFSMQQVTWSEVIAQGGKRLKIKLPEPYKRLEYYRDTYLLAFPSLDGETRPWNETLINITANNGDSAEGFDVKQLIEGDGPGIEINPTISDKPGFILLEFSQAFEARSILIYGSAFTEPSGGGVSSIGPVSLETSDDRIGFHKVVDIQLIGGETPGSASFITSSAKYYRLILQKPSRIKQIKLSGAARISDWTTKANFAGPPPGQTNNLTVTTNVIPAGSIINPASVIDITRYMDADGNLDWRVPPGNWTILRMGHTTTGRINKAAPTTGIGLECDKYNREAFDFHFNKMFENLMPALKSLATNGKVGILIDSYEVGMQNWTKTFPSDFKKSRGYDIVKYLPILTGRCVGSADDTERFLWDFRRVQSDLMADNYYGRCTELCHQNGITSYTEPYNGGPLEQMQMGSRIDVNMGEFWVRTLHFNHSLKIASSIQHINGKKIVGAEAFTGYALYSKWQEHPYAMKAHGDFMFTKGLNRMIFHRYAHQPHPTALPGMTMGPWGIHFDRTNTWWKQGKAWLKYLARCQYMLQHGLFVADLLYYTGEDAPGEDISLRAAPNPAPPKGYDYDNVNTEALLKRLSIKNNQIMLPDGMSYQVLVLPVNKAISIEVLRKIYELVNQGMYLVGAKPEKLTGLSSNPARDTEFRKLTNELWINTDSKISTENSIGKGKVFSGQSLVHILNKLDIQPDFKFTSRSSDPAINYIHRRDADCEIYFLNNFRRRAEDIVCSFRVNGKRPELWNADTGEIIPLNMYQISGQQTQVPIHLDPAGSVFVVFRSIALPKRLSSISKDSSIILNTNNFPVNSAGRYSNLMDNFTIATWIKPDCDVAIAGQEDSIQMLRRFGPKSFVIYPIQGDKIYGEGHATCGLVAGRNGLVVYERTNEGLYPALILNIMLSGWTHITLMYKDGAPLLYVNGKLSATGKYSSKKVHPGLGDEYFDESCSYFEGDMTEPEVFPSTLTKARIEELASAEIPAPDSLRILEFTGNLQSEILFWQNGEYSLMDNYGHKVPVKVSGLKNSATINGPWDVMFPEGLGAPKKITLPQLISLHKHAEFGVKYFSGTATYTKKFTLSENMKTQNNRIFLDLGRVEVIAEVKLNGINMGILWKPPFRIDITDNLNNSENTMEIQVTNLWPNRLIGDEQEPAEYDYEGIAFNQKGGIKSIPDWYVSGKPKPLSARISFTTWKHYNKESPLLESGLVGPVRIITAARYVINV